jgi:hypothetical protein
VQVPRRLALGSQLSEHAPSRHLVNRGYLPALYGMRKLFFALDTFFCLPLLEQGKGGEVH